MSKTISLNAGAICLTGHAAQRLQQRGTLQHLVALVLEHGDIMLHAGNGCETIGLSRSATDDLVREGIPADEAQRAARLKVILADGSRVVTVLHDGKGGNGRRYRRQGRTFSGQARMANG